MDNFRVKLNSQAPPRISNSGNYTICRASDALKAWRGFNYMVSMRHPNLRCLALIPLNKISGLEFQSRPTVFSAPTVPPCPRACASRPAARNRSPGSASKEVGTEWWCIVLGDRCGPPLRINASGAANDLPRLASNAESTIDLMLTNTPSDKLRKLTSVIKNKYCPLHQSIR